ncbi:MAG: glutamine synthetase family protein [Candidatus Thorarchaeota archaeon]|jgi:glutamine synthetase
MSEQIDYLELRFVDILGRLKAMTVPCNPADTIDDVTRDSVLVDGTSLDGSSITGMSMVESSDLRLVPDPSTLVELPYSAQRVAAAMCFVRERGGDEGRQSWYPLDSRGVLHSVCEKYLPGNMQLRVKVEPEFYFVTEEGEPIDGGDYADTYPQSPGADILLEIATAIQSMGMKPRVVHHEVGESQQEIEIDYDDVRKMADFILIFKNLARTVARGQDIDVTFMPKPFEGAAGSGLHCHLQLWDGDHNLFGKSDDDLLSDTGRSFIAGLLEHAPAITAIANSSVNSYKRMVPHHEAPVYITWGFRNRTVLVRVPLFQDPQMAAAEFRSPDATTNPYLLFSAIVASGMDGVDRKLSPPEAQDGNIFSLTDEQLGKKGIATLPSSLKEALHHLEENGVIREAIGSEMLDTFVRVKLEEWREYANEVVTDWEWRKYYSY